VTIADTGAPSLILPAQSDEEYTCLTCHVPQKVLTAYTQNKQGFHGHERHCRTCMSKKRRDVPRVGRRRVPALARRSEAKDTTPTYERMFREQGGRCKACKKPETAGGIVPRRMTFYVFVGSTLRALVCLKCLTVIQQTEASVEDCANITAFLAGGFAVVHGEVATLNIDGKV